MIDEEKRALTHDLVSDEITLENCPLLRQEKQYYKCERCAADLKIALVRLHDAERAVEIAQQRLDEALDTQEVSNERLH